MVGVPALPAASPRKEAKPCAVPPWTGNMAVMGDVIEFEPRFSLTDRQRELMRIHAWVCADSAYDDIEERGGDPVCTTEWWYLFDRLPECTYSESALWRRQMARAFDDLAEDLDAGQLPRPRTMAEQLAIMIVIAQASAALADEGYGDDVAALPTHPRDSDWETVSDGLMDDRDAEAFYHPSTATQWLQIFPCDTWFTPRQGEHPRDPGRGFRR
ncbi:hypothetical protein CH263_08365 [Rhodococcus sp. 06-1059B-a]|nr:hypothetical protein [Rhodococcus sp. 06-1059B-a]OZD68903.1 hypothetical protein CH263_08365 [Rhodococcus sp. 06-1059B-a]